MRERVRKCLESALGEPDAALRAPGLLRWSVRRPGAGAEGSPCHVVLGGLDADGGPTLVTVFDYDASEPDRIRELWIEREEQLLELLEKIKRITGAAMGEVDGGGERQA